MMMMQQGLNANRMSQGPKLVMPPRPNPQQFSLENSLTPNLLAASTPELERAFLNYGQPTASGSLLHQLQQQSQNAAVDGLVRALTDMQDRQELQQQGLPGSRTSSVAESTYSDSVTDLTASPRSTPDFSESSPSSPASTAGGSTETQSISAALAGTPLSSLNPRAQEELKKQRKKERNRIAAMKCRRRKIEREQDLDGKVRLLKSENGDLTAEIVRLRSQVYTLKQTVMDHIASGCNIFQG